MIWVREHVMQIACAYCILHEYGVATLPMLANVAIIAPIRAIPIIK